MIIIIIINDYYESIYVFIRNLNIKNIYYDI